MPFGYDERLWAGIAVQLASDGNLSSGGSRRAGRDQPTGHEIQHGVGEAVDAAPDEFVVYVVFR